MSHDFDRFSQWIGGAEIPRRESLKQIGFAMAATILEPLTTHDAQAGKQPKPRKPQDPCKAFCRCHNKKQLDQCLKACKSCASQPDRLSGTCGRYVCCGKGRTACGDYCADLASDPFNCGACGDVCDAPGDFEYGACIDGLCEYHCMQGAVYCDGICTVLDSDDNNCGGCGIVCGDNSTCYYGACIDSTGEF